MLSAAIPCGCGSRRTRCSRAGRPYRGPALRRGYGWRPAWRDPWSGYAFLPGRRDAGDRKVRHRSSSSRRAQIAANPSRADPSHGSSRTGGLLESRRHEPRLLPQSLLSGWRVQRRSSRVVESTPTASACRLEASAPGGRPDGIVATSHVSSPAARIQDVRGLPMLPTGSGAAAHHRWTAIDVRDQAAAAGSDLRARRATSTDGRPASRGLFGGTAGVRPEIFSFGHRNPQGLLIDPRDGTVWEHEHGPKGATRSTISDPVSTMAGP